MLANGVITHAYAGYMHNVLLNSLLPPSHARQALIVLRCFARRYTRTTAPPLTRL